MILSLNLMRQTNRMLVKTIIRDHFNFQLYQPHIGYFQTLSERLVSIINLTLTILASHIPQIQRRLIKIPRVYCLLARSSSKGC
jgi:hypothetical protein